ncbi:ZZ-type zinc finger domain-containing protein [Vanrija pseudolonga]|uniref:Next to BRCA1 gene 1 protein n=1 Tax=Vanrija pseudolonga TaxID=143232 RepID=A0AAF0YFJ7_9TREE|nr:Next to BRCA1 gene 1 protein [Vanrija pseudolonga]
MLRPAPGGAIPGRPHRPLVVRCGYDGSTRPVNFPSAASCRLESLRTRVEECFALSAWPFVLTYTDDDGEEYHVRTEADLTDAISYFASGDDEGAHSSGAAGRPPAPPKISMRVDVVVEYDGPSLSDTSSIASFRTSEHSWHSSERSAARSDGRSSFEYRSSRGSRYSSVPPITTDLADPLGAMRLSSPGSTLSGGPSSGRSTVLQGRPRASLPPPELDAASASAYSRHRGARTENAYYDDTAPALMGHSELGSRWLREQSQLANRMPRLRLGGRRYDSDDEGLNSDDESLGDIELVQDARGRYYYSYQTETASLSSQSEADFDSMEHAGPSSAGFTSPRLTGGARRTSPETASEVEEVTRAPSSEPTGPPVLAPDCSACGVRLDYMRYVCVPCGEGELWTVNAVGKAPFEPPRLPSEQSDGDATESSEGTAWGPLASSTGSQTVYRGADGRSRSGSMSTNASVHSLAVANGSAVSPGSPRSIQFDLDGNPTPARHRATPRGYELCPSCIEVHGIAHSKAANRERDANGHRKKRSGQLRHTFREKIWGAEGWMDIGGFVAPAVLTSPEYADDSDCTICNTPLVNNRYKCYQKVDEIHPVHVFLSLPDKPLPSLEVASTSSVLGNGHTETRPIRHPGAFCHNCLQDIVGPRFHCAVCPSWDLCIQCEGLTTSGDGQHTADHIMMKIPIPLASSEVEAVSRRARDRWFQQDSSTVARRTPGGSTASRSSSPSVDTETVYAPTRRSARSVSTAARLPVLPNSGRGTPSVTRQQVAARPRDDLDHNARCANCNEWIMGRRYQCANCPSDPEPYNLCSICELRSYRVHDPRHVFFKFDRPVHIPLQSTQPLLPLLYKNRAGQVPASAVLSPHDPTAYLKHVLHRETVCDIHMDQIRGAWFRCAHCAGGFDVCQEAERTADHDPTHVFVVFKARVDMVAFRELASLAASYPKPLLKQQVYFS